MGSLGPLGPMGPMKVYGLLFCWPDYVGSAGLFRTHIYMYIYLYTYVYVKDAEILPPIN